MLNTHDLEHYAEDAAAGVIDGAFEAWDLNGHDYKPWKLPIDDLIAVHLESVGDRERAQADLDRATAADRYADVVQGLTAHDRLRLDREIVREVAVQLPEALHASIRIQEALSLDPALAEEAAAALPQYCWLTDPDRVDRVNNAIAELNQLLELAIVSPRPATTEAEGDAHHGT